jgi:hypothetical protein
MPRLPLSNELKTALVKLLEQHSLKKEHTNAFNRLSTEIRNIFKNRIQSNEWTLGTTIRTNGHEITYDAAESSIINPADLYAKLKGGEITEDQFLRCIRVSKTDVTNILGSDVTLLLETPVKGDNYNIRIKELDLENSNDEFIVVPQATDIKRKTRRSLDKTVSAKTPSVVSRKIRIKRSDQ